MMASVSTVGATGTMIPIDVSMAGAIVKSATTLQLRNVKVPGYGNYKINLTWDPERLVFSVQSVEIDTLPQFAMLPQPVQATWEPNQPDYDNLCATALGAMYRMGSWEEVKAAVGASPDNLATLVNTLNLTTSSQVLVKYGGNVRRPTDSYMYFFQYGSDPSFGIAGITSVTLDSTQSALYVKPQHRKGNANLLCTKGSATAPF